MNARRKLLIALSSAASIPRIVFAQSKKPPFVIGWLANAARASYSIGDFKEAMAAFGWIEGSTYVLEERSTDGVRDRLPSLAADLAAKRPDVIVALPASATIAATKAAPHVAIVQSGGTSPVELGLAASLGRPGGMVTGVTNIITDLSAKYLELLIAAAPKLKRIGFLFDRNSPSYATYMKNMRIALERFRVEARFAEVAKVEEIEPAIGRLAKEGAEGLVLLPGGGLFSPAYQRIATLALTQRWPLISSSRSLVERGALMSYGTGSSSRRVAYYVDRILKGTKPGDIPIEQPMTFELAVNLKTAKALGLSVPPEIMVRATHVFK